MLKQIIPVLKLDGYSGLIWGMFLTTDTRYSESYTNRKFLEIEKGMTKSQVYAILGKPIDVWIPEEGLEALAYSISPSDTNYRIRYVYFSDSKVKETVSYFYVD